MQLVKVLRYRDGHTPSFPTATRGTITGVRSLEGTNVHQVSEENGKIHYKIKRNNCRTPLDRSIKFIKTRKLY